MYGPRDYRTGGEGTGEGEVNTQKKVVTLVRLKNIVARLRKQGRSIAFTNGCFDILHFGHVRYLEEAKKRDRILIVGVNSDLSVKKIKGPRRPIVGERERASLLAALECVDYVTIFPQSTPLKVIETLKPDIIIKGADWKGQKIVGSDFVRTYGGREEFIHYWKNFSTTNIIESVLKKCKR